MTELQNAYDALVNGANGPAKIEWRLRACLSHSVPLQPVQYRFKTALDQELHALTEKELLWEFGERDKSQLDSTIGAMAAASETFAHYLKSQHLFGVRFYEAE